MATQDSTGPRGDRSRKDVVLPSVAVFGSLLLYLSWRIASSWRYFDRFLGDDGWVLRASQRVADGEVLYRDIAWDYGPLPIYGLGLLFRLSPTVVWFHVLDALLCLLAVGALYLLARSSLSQRANLVVTVWAAVLGSAGGLFSHQLGAYTSAVSWGTATSLMTVAAACIWLRSRSSAALTAALLFAVLAVLSKPEYGLAALCAFGMALWLGRPSKPWIVVTASCTAVLVVAITLFADRGTLAAAWRGYTGYDLIAVGSVPVLELDRLLGSLPVAAGVAGLLWWSTRTRSVILVGVVVGILILVMWLSEGRRFLHAIGIVAQVSWVGAVPALLGLALVARRSSVPAGFWIVWTFSIVVNLRPLLVGDFAPAAAGTVAVALAILAVSGRLRRPTRPGWVVLAAFLLFSSVAPEIRSREKPPVLQTVDTTLGAVRVTPRSARTIEFVREALDEAPPGDLFVLGWGPAWYLTSGRPNPTRFDGIHYGLGTTEPELSEILEALRASSTVAVLLEERFHPPPRLAQGSIWKIVGEPEPRRLTSPDRRWTLRIITSR
jgi:hypothetical protein